MISRRVFQNNIEIVNRFVVMNQKRRIMKNCMLFILGIVIPLTAASQTKIKVLNINKSMSMGTKSGLTVYIPEADYKSVEKLWKKKAKGFGGKTSSSKGEILCDDARLKKISANTCDIYAISTAEDEGATLTVFIDLGGKFLSSSDAGYGEAEKMVYAFAVDAAKDAANMELKMQEKALNKMENELKRLERDNEDLHSDIGKWEESIEKAKLDIEQNVKDQDEKRADIQNQQQTVELVMEKIKKIK